VLDGYDFAEFFLNTGHNSKDRPTGILVKVDLSPWRVVSHPDEGTDLCAILTGDVVNRIISDGNALGCVHLDEQMIPKDEDWQFFDAIEDVVMVGCPNGLADEVNHLPIFRRGITASALSKQYNGLQQFVVDMACFPGSSGSPIFLLDRNGYTDRKTGSFMVGASRVSLIGVLFAGPTISTTGEVLLAKPPQFSLQSMMHLGFALKSTAVISLGEEVLATRS